MTDVPLKSIPGVRDEHRGTRRVHVVKLPDFMHKDVQTRPDTPDPGPEPASKPELKMLGSAAQYNVGEI